MSAEVVDGLGNIAGVDLVVVAIQFVAILNLLYELIHDCFL